MGWFEHILHCVMQVLVELGTVTELKLNASYNKNQTVHL